MRSLASWFFPLVIAMAVAGCLPGSCRKIESRELFPADSVSRQIASSMPVDTMRVLWSLESAGGSENDWDLPRTIRYYDNGDIVIADTRKNSIAVVTSDGVPAYWWHPPELDLPYLVGVSGDTVVVFSAGADRVDWIVGGETRRTLQLPARANESELRYGGYDPPVFFLKTSGESGGSVTEYRPEGVATVSQFDGPVWRYAGPIVVRGDSVISFRGFRPTVDVWLSIGGSYSLQLVGFDSPMLARSRGFLEGTVHSPPLLISSGAVEGDRIFVLNLRPGWVRVDVYDVDGKLQRILVEETPEFNSKLMPTDMAIRKEGDELLIAITKSQPVPGVVVFAVTDAPAD